MSQNAVVMVTGGAGFIGSQTCKALSTNGYVPVAFDDLSRGSKSLVRYGPFFVGDITDPTAIRCALEKFRPVSVIHCAGVAFVGESFADPTRYFRINTVGTLNLVDAMVAHGVANLVFASSCSTYGSRPVVLSEDAPQTAESPYASSKILAERIIEQYGGSVVCATLRYFNVCGADPDEGLGEMDPSSSRLLTRVITAATGRGAPLVINGADYPTVDGTAVRDFVHVKDVATAHVAAVRYLESGRGPIVANISTGVGHSVLEVVEEVESVSGRVVPRSIGPRQQGDAPHLVAPIGRAAELLGFNPVNSDLKQIVSDAWRWHNRSH